MNREEAIMINIKHNKPFSNTLKRKQLLTYFMLITIGLVMIIPVFMLVVTSLKTLTQVIANPLSFLPSPLSFDSYIKVFTEVPFFQYLLNTLFITVFQIFGSVFTAALVAYGFARFPFRHKEVIFVAFLLGMMVPAQVLTIPLFELYTNYGWINTFLPFIIPPFFGGGIFNIFLARQFFRGIPTSLFESAELDGCNEFMIFWKIILPLSKPLLLTIGIFAFINSWNDLFGPLLYLQDENLWTLAKGTYALYTETMAGGGQPNWPLLAAANVIIIIPVVILYFFAQRYFIEGINMTGIKG